MVKKTFNLLIIALLASSTCLYATDFSTTSLPKTMDECGIDGIQKKDTLKKKGKKPVKKERITKGKRVSFENFEQSYERAMRYYSNQQYLSAASLFEELYPLSLGTPRADTILFLFAHSYYCNKDYNMAAFHFRDYVKRYPNTPRTEDAFYYCVSAIYKTSPEYSLDQSNTEYAIEQIKSFVVAYPNNDHIEECNSMLDDLRLKMARKNLEILKLYYNTDKYEACQISAKNFFNEYSYSPLMPEAVYYLVLNNLEYAQKSVEHKKEERYKACLDACTRMEVSFSGSDYYKETSKIAEDVRKQLEKHNKQNNK